ncbi:serine hydrolase domain-containing protein [Yinghuangia seranimata]|uniref:serine hydrolase domain-containing protein n=1 Tax=Yinghuangia seranimata TaxID=408067 RepID=UPI00248AF5BC|nr:serine hydrolase domain-containing protein [Yinghuangia seranimata]MDI2127312.1 serine hydrolase domain-containing protein [Yinghuangia seranimata]
MEDATVQGHAAPEFAAVEREFRTHFAERGEVGAALAVQVRGLPVVDLWGGLADPETGRPWEHDTVQVVWSATKGLVATCLAMLADRGRLDYASPVCRYWPEFAAAGKQRVTVGELLSHQAGLPFLDEPIPLSTVAVPDALSDLLAAQRPHWEPGTAHGYHAVTWGFYAAELLRRIDGRTVGAFLNDEVAGPLGVRAYIGTPREVAATVATLVPAPPAVPAMGEAGTTTAGTGARPGGSPDPAGSGGTQGGTGGRGGVADRGAATPSGTPASDTSDTSDTSASGAPAWDPDSDMMRAMLTLPELALPGADHDPDVLALEIPSGCGVTNARALARVYAALAAGGTLDGVRLMAPDSVKAATTTAVEGQDRILGELTAFAQGFMKPSTSFFQVSGNPEAFGHPGSGGTLAFADPACGLSFAYVTNGQTLSHTDWRALSLVDAVYRVLAA